MDGFPVPRFPADLLLSALLRHPQTISFRLYLELLRVITEFGDTRHCPQIGVAHGTTISLALQRHRQSLILFSSEGEEQLLKGFQ
jgi:hypothetical protein